MKKLIVFAVLAMICVMFLSTCGNGGDDSKSGLLAAPVYPEMAQYPDEAAYYSAGGEFDSYSYDEAYSAWLDAYHSRQYQDTGYTVALDGYLRRTVPQLLSGEAGANRVCSPVNIYMALAMLAETTDGESRAQILELLGSESLEDLRGQSKAVWSGNYCDDGAMTSVLANSMWLSDSLKYVPQTIDALAENYYASSFRGQMGSDTLNEALQGWVNEQTGGLLQEQAAGIRTTPDTVLALCSTVYFRDKWSDQFSADLTVPQAFHSPAGDVEGRFMHGTLDGWYYLGGQFSAVPLSLEGGGAMWLLLPDEGVTPETLVSDGRAVSFLLSDKRSVQRREALINLALPKFDVTAQLDLSDNLRQLGVTDIFDAEAADFSPLIKDAENVVLSSAEHAARVVIDEEGLTAAAYTVEMPLAADDEPEKEEIDFVLDRPFVFAVTSHDGLPLFVGIINVP